MASGSPEGSDDDPELTETEGKVLDREEIDFTDDERVATLDEESGRYVVSTGSGPPAVVSDEASTDEPEPDSQSGETPDGKSSQDEETTTASHSSRSSSPQASGETSRVQRAEQRPETEHVETARDTVASNLRNSGGSFGFDSTLLIEGHTSRHFSTSEDIESMTRGLLHWLALTVDDGTPEDEVLGILLLASGVSVRYPTNAVTEYVQAHDLSPDDDIRELLKAIQSEGGFRIPRETRPTETPDYDPDRTDKP